jgi:hypothetical protein
MQTLWLDIRHAFRLMRQSRAVTAIAVLSLALAIGVNASIFSLLNAVVLRALDAPRPDQRQQQPARNGSCARGSRRRSTSFSVSEHSFSSSPVSISPA